MLFKGKILLLSSLYKKQKMGPIIGWIVLISSWIIPLCIEDEEKRILIRLMLSSLATGIFTGIILSKII